MCHYCHYTGHWLVTWGAQQWPWCPRVPGPSLSLSLVCRMRLFSIRWPTTGPGPGSRPRAPRNPEQVSASHTFLWTATEGDCRSASADQTQNQLCCSKFPRDPTHRKQAETVPEPEPGRSREPQRRRGASGWRGRGHQVSEPAPLQGVPGVPGPAGGRAADGGGLHRGVSCADLPPLPPLGRHPRHRYSWYDMAPVRESSDHLYCSVYVVPALFLDHFDSMFPKSERYSEV